MNVSLLTNNKLLGIQPIHKDKQEGVFALDRSSPTLIFKVQSPKSMTGGPGRTLMAAVIFKKANENLEQASTALSLMQHFC
eukprot:1155074-Pelagomonas_calceolata.AAC.2